MGKSRKRRQQIIRKITHKAFIAKSIGASSVFKFKYQGNIYPGGNSRRGCQLFYFSKISSWIRRALFLSACFYAAHARLYVLRRVVRQKDMTVFLLLAWMHTSLTIRRHGMFNSSSQFLISLRTPSSVYAQDIQD